MNTTPQFTHDCERCDFLGRFEEYDLYYCAQIPGLPTVIARYGDEGSEYISGLVFGQQVPAIDEAKTRAIKHLQARLDNPVRSASDSIEVTSTVRYQGTESVTA